MSSAGAKGAAGQDRHGGEGGGQTDYICFLDYIYRKLSAAGAEGAARLDRHRAEGGGQTVFIYNYNKVSASMIISIETVCCWS